MLLILVLLCMVSRSQQNIVSLAQGMVRGEVHDGVVSYKGIPYATMDDENSRFKEAGIAPTWFGIRESQPSRCSFVSELEECLKLEVHVPIHGGPWPVFAWVRGGSGHYNPWSLVQHGIVVVVVSHRLGAPGFLCLGDELIPGNAGVKDVVFALRWVRDNVSAFNGNPHRVVVAGQGLGAAVAEILTLSPAAKDLMHGAILQSGSIQCPWSFNYDAMERAKSLINIIENDYSSNVSISTIDIKYLARYSHKLPFPYYPFGLCVENSLKQGRLIEHSPNQLLYDRANLKIPIIAGYNSNEAYVFVSNLQQNNVFRKVRNLSKLLPQELQFISDVEKRDVLNQIHDLYFKGNHSTVALLSYYSDAYFVNHIYRSVRLQAQSHRTIYFYQFSRTSKLGVSPIRGVNKTGAAHSDELGFLFPPRGMDMDAHDGNIHKQDPTPNNEVDVRWEPFDETDPRVLDIDTEIEMKRFPRKRTCEIWDDIFQRFYYGRNVP